MIRNALWDRILRGEDLLLDNVAVTEGLGKSISTDTIGGVEYARGKLIFGVDGVNAGDVAATNPFPVQHQLNTTDLTEIALNFAASGDNQIVAGTAAQIIRVWAFWLKVNGAAGVDLKFRTAANDLHPALPFLHREGWVMPFQSRPWFTCTVAEALQMNLSAAIQISGRLYYTKG